MPEKDPSYPRDRNRGISAPETFCLSGSHSWKHPLVPQPIFWGCHLLPAAHTCLIIPGQDADEAAYLAEGREGAGGGPSSQAVLCFGLASEEKAEPRRVQRKGAT